MAKAVIIVIDGVGVGEMPDAYKYGESGANTLKHVSEKVGGLSLPRLQSMGLGNIADLLGYELAGVPKVNDPQACFGYASERSNGKDSLTGHFEMIGIVRDIPFVTYPGNFPPSIVEKIEKVIGRKVIECGHASGTEIIVRYGHESISTGHPIIYTSEDSVLQIAAHEDVIPPSELYEMCMAIREVMRGEHEVGRVIARPFTTIDGKFVRTERRRDFGLVPDSPNLLTILKEANLRVMACGKIDDIFTKLMITDTIHASNNADIVRATLDFLKTDNDGLIFTNLIDFDQLYGHRNDSAGFAECLKVFDGDLDHIIEAMAEDDLLIITADHGNDPTTESTDHNREYVPILSMIKSHVSGNTLGERKTFADIGATVSEYFGIKWSLDNGESFLNILKK